MYIHKHCASADVHNNAHWITPCQLERVPRSLDIYRSKDRTWLVGLVSHTVVYETADYRCRAKWPKLWRRRRLNIHSKTLPAFRSIQCGSWILFFYVAALFDGWRVALCFYICSLFWMRSFCRLSVCLHPCVRVFYFCIHVWLLVTFTRYFFYTYFRPVKYRGSNGRFFVYRIWLALCSVCSLGLIHDEKRGMRDTQREIETLRGKEWHREWHIMRQRQREEDT